MPISRDLTVGSDRFEVLMLVLTLPPTPYGRIDDLYARAQKMIVLPFSMLIWDREIRVADIS